MCASVSSRRRICSARGADPPGVLGIDEEHRGPQQRDSHDLPLREEVVEFGRVESLDARPQSEEGGARVLGLHPPHAPVQHLDGVLVDAVE